MNYLMLFVGLSFFIYKIILVRGVIEGSSINFNCENRY
ncbi:hypothetical protein SAMN03080594_101856 [Arenibacter palladensis]|uniref:Uncharacterized protein n=1 Tax=Arenibacter palladensis TaxID=237373 RepID=A0A1M4V652_9FLAO|nr:hypothetical protein SAMN03080594_101856 [Arenibacter palladensis]